MPKVITCTGLRHFGTLERFESWSTCQTVFPGRSTFIAVIEYICFIDCIACACEAQCRDTSRQNVVTFRHTRVRFPFAPFNEFRTGVFHACCVFLQMFSVDLYSLPGALSKVFQHQTRVHSPNAWESRQTLRTSTAEKFLCYHTHNGR